MAEGGGEFGFDEGDTLLGHTDDQDDDDEQEAERTQPFQPGAASTPYHGGETIEMKTRQHEQTGLPESYVKVTDEELRRRLDALRNPATGFLDDSGITLVPPDLQQKEIERVKKFIKARYPNAKVDNLVIKFCDKNQIVVLGPRQGETKIVLDDGSGFRKDFLNKTFVKKILEDGAEEIIRKNSASIREKEKEFEELRKQKADAEQRLLEQNELVMSLNERLNKEKAKIDQLKDLPEYEEEIKRKKQLTKNLEKDLKDAIKERKERETKLKKLGDQHEKNARLEASIAEEIKKRNAMEERLNSTKSLDDLKEQESELQRQNEEDQAIIRDENASPSYKEAARERVAERNEELACLQTQIAERERGRPLSERIKEIFKKYGVTVTAILLAAGTTIAAVVGSIKNSLKATRKSLGKDLKDIGSKVASLLPGLIGSIVSFLFKAAGQVVGFLAEHTWLLILAAVAFLFEKYLKKQR